VFCNFGTAKEHTFPYKSDRFQTQEFDSSLDGLTLPSGTQARFHRWRLLPSFRPTLPSLVEIKKHGRDPRRESTRRRGALQRSIVLVSMRSQAIRLALIIVGASAYLGLAVLGEGGPSHFLSDPAVKSLAIVLLTATLIAFFAGGNVDSGVREDRSNRWVLSVFIVLTLADGYFPALCDRLGLWTLGGESIRWVGVAAVAIGCVLRIWPVFVLGDRFSAMVAIQEGHRLVIDGPYRFVRNPSYLGIIVIMAGWALVFRSLAGLLIASLMVPFLIIRIDSEERLLRQAFGSDYDAYVEGTKRLVPGLY